MQGNRVLSWLAGCALLSACGPTPPPDSDAGEFATPEQPIVHAAGGYLDHARSPLVPFCGAVLIAPDVVVTAAACAEDGWADLSFGIGEPGGELIPVVGSTRHPDAGEQEHALVALVLERPVPGAVAVDALALDAMPCEVDIPTYTTATRDHDAPRSLWGACGIGDDPSVLVAVDGHPSCHGDSGAGAFVRDDSGLDHVIGWVTGAGHLGEPNPINDICVTSVELATVAANVDFLLDARSRSRITAPF